MVKKSEVATAVVGEVISVKIKKGGEYGVWGIEVMRSVPLQEGQNVSEVIEFSTKLLQKEIDSYVTSLGVNPPSFMDEVSSPTSSEEEAEPVEVTEDLLREMEKQELLDFIKENHIDVDTKKTKKLADLVEAVIAAIFPPEEESVVEVTEEDIRAMEKDELVKFIKDNELDIPYEKIKKLSILVEMVVEAITPEEEAGEEEAGEEITPEMVREMERPELLELISQESLEIDVKKIKKLADLAEKVIEMLFSEEVDDGEEGSPFDDTDFGDE